MATKLHQTNQLCHRKQTRWGDPSGSEGGNDLAPVANKVRARLDLTLVPSHVTLWNPPDPTDGLDKCDVVGFS